MFTDQSAMVQAAYLSIREQEHVRSKFAEAKTFCRPSEIIFLDNGEKFAALSTFTAGLVFWRAGFRACNLHKFGRFRITSFLFNVIFCLHGGCAHAYIVDNELNDLYRSESVLKYGIRSLLANQLGLISISVGTMGATFTLAQRFGLIPIPHNFYQKDVRPVVYEFIKNSLKPYYRSMSIAWLASSVVMFAVGARQYQESRNILSTINRRTLSQKED